MAPYLIVGGSKGIGLALATHLAAEHPVIVWARTRGELPEHANIQFQEVDVLNGALPALPEKLSGMAYCPGSIFLSPFNRIKPEQFQADFNINVLAAIQAIQQAIPALKANPGASVVLFSTVAVQTGMPFHASIAAAKGAVEGLTRSLAAEYAAAQIRFNAIAPSLTNTHLAEKLLAGEDKQLAAAKRHPIGRYGQPEDLASLAAFLLQPASSWITGQILHADGGMSSLRLL